MKGYNMELEVNLKYTFKNIELLNEALTHTSYANENNVNSNEKLEFFGDAILEFVSSKYLYANFPELSEGELTKTRAAVVCEDSLYEVAKRLNVNEYIKVGHSELNNDGNNKPAILADSIEAIIAAIYFDGGLEEAEKFIIENLKGSIEEASKHVGAKDYKTVLQEKLQENGEVKIEYKIINEEGPAHDKVFTAQVLLNDKVLAEGKGKSKKLAEMDAARIALGG